MLLPLRSRSAATRRFVEQFLRDCSLGRYLPLEHYLARHPGGGGELVRAYLALAGGTNGPGPRANGHWRPGMRFGRFELLCELGCGREASVFGVRETHAGPRRMLALKILHASDPGRVADRLSHLEHATRVLSERAPGRFCRVHECGVHQASAWIAMRWVRGATLARCLAFARAREAGVPEEHGACVEAPGRLPARPGPRTPGELARLLEFFALAARALALAHELGIAHGDLHASNLMQDTRGGPVLLDVGAEGAGDPAADVRALAELAVECLCLRPVPVALAARTLVPLELRALIEEALAPEPLRQPRMEELAEVLECGARAARGGRG